MPNNKNNKKNVRSGDQRIIVRTQPSEEPDLRRLARALIELARQELEAEQADGQAESSSSADEQEAA